MLGLDRSKTLDAPRFDGNPPRIAIISSRYFPDVADPMLAQVKDTLKGVFADNDTFEVAGVLDLPSALSMAVQSGNYEGYIVLGAVIDGENGEVDIYREALHAITMIAAEGYAVGTCLLWADTKKKLSKISSKRGKLGSAAATAALHLVTLSRKLLSDIPEPTGESSFKPEEDHIVIADAPEPRAEPMLTSPKLDDVTEVAESSETDVEESTQTV